MRKTTLWYAALGMLLATSSVLAAEGGESSIFAGDIGNVFWTLLVFGLVVFILGKYAWGPLLDVLQKREDFIRSSLEEAKKDREAAEERLKEYEEQLREGRAEATAIVEEGRRDAEVLRARIREEAQADSEEIAARAQREVRIARETAVKELYELSGQLAAQIASRIVDREIQAADHEKLIEGAIAELGRHETAH